MSVIWFGNDELQQIHAGIQRIKTLGLEDREKTEALQAARYSNAVAFGSSYSAEIKVKPFRFDEDYPDKLKPAELYHKIDSLMYNCISNGGKDFLPEQAKEVLRFVQQEIARNALRRLEEQEGLKHV